MKDSKKMLLTLLKIKYALLTRSAKERFELTSDEELKNDKKIYEQYSDNNNVKLILK